MIRAWYNNQYLNGTPSLSWYQNLFSSSQGRRGWNADFSNLSALIQAEGWKQLREEISKEIKVIYILRQPCERLWSQYKFSGQSHESINSSEYEQQIGNFLRSSTVNRHSQYCSNLDAVCEGLGHQNVKTILLDDIHNQPEALLASVEQFLEIPAQDHSSHTTSTAGSQRRSKLPAVFRQHCAPIVEREIEGLKERGIAVPRRWTDDAGMSRPSRNRPKPWIF